MSKIHVYRVKKDNCFFAEFYDGENVYVSNMFYDKELAINHARMIYLNAKNPERAEKRRNILDKLKKEEYNDIRKLCIKYKIEKYSRKTRHELEMLLAVEMSKE